jgi:hypothetical protein
LTGKVRGVKPEKGNTTFNYADRPRIDPAEVTHGSNFLRTPRQDLDTATASFRSTSDQQDLFREYSPMSAPYLLALTFHYDESLRRDEEI